MSAAKPAASTAAPGPATAPAAAAAKPKKKLLVIISAALVVVAGGGAGAYFAFAGKGDDVSEEKTDVKAGAKGKKSAKAPPHVEKLPAQFVAMDPPFVVNFEPGATARFLQITVQIMTRDLHTAEFLETNSPIIRNDLLLLFGNKHVEEVSTNEGKEELRVAALKAVRKIAADEGHEPETVEAVYFTSFVMQ